MSQSNKSKDLDMNAFAKILGSELGAQFKQFLEVNQQPKPIDPEARKHFMIMFEKDYEQKRRNSVMLSKRLQDPKNLVPFSIDQIYKEYLGSHVPVSIGGNYISIPVDGKTRMIPREYIPYIQSYIRHIGDKVYNKDQGGSIGVLETPLV